jgi:uncharacterized delta-60 repeat protein
MISPIVRRLALTVATAALAGCGGSGNTPTPQPPPPLDNLPPTVVAIAPSNGAGNVDPGTVVSVTFSEAMDPVSLSTPGTFTLAPALGGEPVAGTLSCSGASATFTPSGPLAWGTPYRATVSVAARDVAGNPLTAPSTWWFTIRPEPDLAPPTVTGRTPASAATGVAIDAAVAVTFSEPVDPATVTTLSFRVAPSGGAALDGTASVSGALATFTPALALAYGTTYDVTIGTAVRDLAGNALAAPESWSFKTALPPGADVTPPHVVAIAPGDGALLVPLRTSVTATFDEAVDPATVDSTTFRLEAPGGEPVAATIALSALGTVATLRPASALAGSTTYTARVTTAVTDLAGNALAAERAWTFMTIAPDTYPPYIRGRTPWNADAVPVTAAVTIIFSERVDPATLTAETFRLAPTGSAAIAATISIGESFGDSVATLTPAAPLAYSTDYTVTVSGAVTDLAGNPLGADDTWGFRTGPDALDPSFGVDGATTATPGTASAIAIAPDGKIVVAGHTGQDPNFALLVARFDASGALDGGFGTNGRFTWNASVWNDYAEAVAVGPDGKVLVGGCSGAFGVVLRLDAQGALDPGFGMGGAWTWTEAEACVQGLALQPDGRVVAVGYSCPGATCEQLLVRLLPDGTLDPDFGASGVVRGGQFDVAVALQPDGQIVVGDREGLDFVLRRYDSGGALDASFGDAGIFRWARGELGYANAAQEYLAGLTLAPDGGIVMSGSSYGTTTEQMVVRASSTGALDPTFGTTGAVTLTPWGAGALAVDSDGRTLVCSKLGSSEAALLRLDGAGHLDPTFAEAGVFGWAPAGTYPGCSAVALQPAQRAVIAVSQQRWTTPTLETVNEIVLLRLR